MSAQQLVTVIVRLFAIGLVIHSFQNVFFSLEDAQGNFTKLAAAYFGISLIIAAILWRFPMLVAGKTFSSKEESEPRPHWDHNKLYSVGFVFIGLAWLVLAMSDLIFWVTYAIYAAQMGYGAVQLNADDKSAIVSTLFEVIIALTLMFGSRGWLRFVSYIRFGKSELQQTSRENQID